MRIEILDHGYVSLIEHWGSDERIIEAARMSTDKGFLGWGPTRQCRHCKALADELGPIQMWQHCSEHEGGSLLHVWEEKPGDEKLLAYLWNNKHATPFEMAGIVIEVMAPIFVFREWHRHRTQSYNEMSARYIPLPDVNYAPNVNRCLVVQGSNKQASSIAGADVLTHESVLEWLTELEESYAHSEAVYQSGLRRGIPKEIARLPVPVGRYSKMRASTNLRNWLAFLTLRQDAAAQLEIREYANAVASIVGELFPRTAALYSETRA